jgi:hypothetical protein
MADFRFYKMRFTWRGEWSTGTAYVKDDIVTYGAKTFVCLVGHTAAANFYTDLDFVDITQIPNVPAPKWALQVDGYTYKKEWVPNEFYNLGDIVKYNGMIYICVVHHTSNSIGLYHDYTKWIVYVKSDYWRNDWQTNTRYQIGDVVKYNGFLYRCNYSHQSADIITGLEIDSNFWDTVLAAEQWRQDWQTSTRYRENDVVKYGGIVYRCKQGHTSASTIAAGLEQDLDLQDSTLTKWEVVHSNIEYKTDWTASTRYKLNDVVKYGGSLWICTVYHTSTTSFQDTKWTLYVPGFQFENGWDGTVVYQKGDVVRYGGYFYTALVNNVGVTPTTAVGDSTIDVWQLLTKNYQVTGDWSNIFNYRIGSVTRREGQVYLAKQDNVGKDPNSNSTEWELLIPGEKFQNFWNTTTTYEIGDIVTYKQNTYVCILQHTPVLANRPDTDTTDGTVVGTYWKLYIKGEPTNSLITQGDLKTYSTTQDRIALGTEGQALRVVTGTASWYSFNSAAAVYYVAPEGIDQPNNGTTLQNPWRTIRYACGRVSGPATIFVKTGSYSEILPISIPADVAVVGEELRSTLIQPAAGYETSNMFYMRNGSGLRNCTLSGLTGTLGPFDTYITRRPTAGAYVSLDPGYGPADTSTWITTRSPYVQNVTTFGTGCTGCKIDGSLHNGGNRSIVSNDFTQVLSDGIGVWCTNLGLTELVSVFSYYGHIGYLAENGGKIRATNGNSSYGAYGTVALGFDQTETPITGIVDNRTKQAQIRSAFSGEANDFVLRYEYSNAGQNYTTVNYTVVGSGVNISTVNDEFRDSAVFEAQLIDNTGTTGSFGGNGYYNIGNNAQAGDLTTVTLATGDQNTFNTYRGMRAIIQSGTGTGQYGYVVGFNTSSKVLSVAKESFQPVIAASSSSSTNLFTTDGATYPYKLYVNQPVYFDFEPIAVTATGINVSNGIILSSVTGLSVGMTITFTSATVYGGIQQNFTYYIKTINGNIITISQNFNGATFTVTAFANITMTGTANSNIGGVSLGTLYYIKTVPSATTFSISSLPGGATINLTDGAGAMRTNAAGWDHVNLGFPAVALLDTTSVYRIEPRPSWSRPPFSITTGTVSSSGTWIAEGSGCFGNGRYLAITTSGSVVYSTDGTTWTNATMPSSGGGSWAFVTFGNGRFVAVAAPSSTAAYSTDGINWSTSVLPTNTSWSSAAYCNFNNRWVAVSGSSGTIAAYSTDNGASWLSSTLPTTGNWASVACGSGITVAIASGSTAAAYSTNGGQTWTAATLPTSATWSAVNYGDGRFLAVAQANTIVAQTYNGSTWTQNPPLPFSANWVDISYGQGSWLAVCSDVTANFATSDNGIYWTQRTSSQSQGRSSATFGSISGVGRWIVFPASGNAIDIVSSGSTTRGRIELSGSTLSLIKLWEPGSSYTSATCTITDPSAITAAVVNNRIANGVLANPSFVNRGIGYKTSTTVVTATGDGFADIYPFGNTMYLKNLTRLPKPGANLIFDQIIWSSYGLPSSGTWSDAVYGTKFVAVRSGSNAGAYSTDGSSWSASILPASVNWSSVVFGNGIYMAVANGSATAAISSDGITWTSITLPGALAWTSVAYGSGKFVVVASGSNTVIWSVDNGTTWTSTTLPSSGAWIKVVSGANDFFALRSGSNQAAYSSDGTVWAVRNLPITAAWTSATYASGISTYVFAATGNSLIYTVDSGANFTTVTLPVSANWSKILFGYQKFVLVAADSANLLTSKDGITWTARSYTQTTNTALANGNGYFTVLGTNTAARGSDGSTDIQYKVLTITETSGSANNYRATFTVSPTLNKTTSPVNGVAIEVREKYSQVRLTGHDMLAIGTGNKTETNYPYVDVNDYLPGNETYFRGGGRVFYTTTDQDGNFRVGQLFAVQQATGIITISADYFNLNGLSSLTLGGIAVGGNATIINEFSTDATFTADSNSIIPTQKAIKQYIARRISGGGSNAATGTLVAGTVSIGPTSIGSTTNTVVRIPVKMRFIKGLGGSITAMTFFTETFDSRLDFVDPVRQF